MNQPVPEIFARGQLRFGGWRLSQKGAFAAPLNLFIKTPRALRLPAAPDRPLDLLDRPALRCAEPNFLPALNRTGGEATLSRGFSLLELLVALSIGAIFLAIAVPSYLSYLERLKVTTAIRDIGELSARIQSYATLNNSLPPDLAAVGWDQVLDPWGHPYAYLSFTGLNGKAEMRKDKNLVPINTQFDLYSMGADGQSRPPLTASVSQDDVIMANDGSYIGLAANY